MRVKRYQADFETPIAMLPNPFLHADIGARSLNRIEFEMFEAGETRRLRGYPDVGSPFVWEHTLAWATAQGFDQLDGLEVERRFFAACEDSYVQSVAESFGMRLGHLLLALKTGHALRDDWGREHAAYWQRVERVVLGGGRIRGWFGDRVLHAARKVVSSTGLQLDRSGSDGTLSHLGLARLAPLTARYALLFDFGQTSIKVACATLTPTSVDAVQPLFAVPSRCAQMRDATHRWRTMLAVIDQALDVAKNQFAIDAQTRLAVCIAVASYLQDGRLSPFDQGCYGMLQQLSGTLYANLHAAIAERMGIGVPLVLSNDGSAAGAAYAGESCVVITLGTALGIGFPDELAVNRT